MSSEVWLTIIKILGIILVACVVNLVVNLIFKNILKKRDKIKERNKGVLTNILILGKIKNVILICFVVIASLFQIPGLNSLSWSVLSGAGVISIILGYASQKTLSNFFCGLGIAFSDPFEIGDFIKCVDIDFAGYVENITLRHTIIRTIDNRRLIIPNGKLDDMTIENYNHTDNEVCRFAEFSIAYSADVDKAIEILKEEMGKMYNPNINGIPKNVEFPKVRVVKWADSSIVLRGWVWGADNAMTHENIFNLNYIIKKRFDEENIEIPYNYLNIVDRTEREKPKSKKTSKSKKTK